MSWSWLNLATRLDQVHACYRIILARPVRTVLGIRCLNTVDLDSASSCYFLTGAPGHDTIGSDSFSLITAVLAGVRIPVLANQTSSQSDAVQAAMVKDAGARAMSLVDPPVSSDSNVPAVDIVLDDSSPQQVRIQPSCLDVWNRV